MEKQGERLKEEKDFKVILAEDGMKFPGNKSLEHF